MKRLILQADWILFVNKPAVKYDNREGFVLPYVLLVIAMLAIASALTAQYFIKTSALMREIDTQVKAQIAFANAESQAIYSILSSNPVDGGFDLSGEEQLIPDDFLTEVTDISQNDIWLLQSELRLAPTEQGLVYVSLQDLSGLISLNVAPSDYITKLLVHLGVAEQKALSLSAALMDYRDADNRRQFRGAERADYRLKGMPSPTNSPLRHYAELYDVLGWKEAMTEIDVSRLKTLSSLNQSYARVNRNFMPPELLSVFPEDADAESEDFDIFAAVSANQIRPTNFLRVTLTYPSAEGVVWQRVIDVERRAGSPNKPFERRWLFDKVLTEQEAERYLVPSENLKNVVYATANNL